MTDITTVRLATAAAASLLLALPTQANRLLNENWIATASKEQITKVIAAGADVNAVQSQHNYTPLLAATKHGNIGAMQALLEAEADPNLPPKPGLDVAMHWAASGKAVLLLLDYGARIEIRDPHGRTPLHFAANRDKVDALRALVRRGADIEALDNKERTPLLRAAELSRPPAVQILLEAGADVNAASARGWTPLHGATAQNTPQMAQVLLDAGADPILQTKLDPDGTGRFFPAELAIANPKFRNSSVLVRLFAPLGDIQALPGETSDAPCDGWRVQPGDTGFIIAEKGLGDRSRFVEIGRDNNLSGANMHRVGMCLKLPGRKTSVTPARPEASCDGYMVQASDRKLGDIAEKALGDRSRWPEIARLNGVTAEKPYRLGQCLTLPG